MDSLSEFPRSRSGLSPEAYLTRILLGLVAQCSGDLRIDARSFELDKNAKLVVDWDAPAQQLVVRSVSLGAEVFGANPCQPAKPSNSPAQPSPSTTITTTLAPPASSTSSTHALMTPERIEELLKQRERAAAIRRLREEGQTLVSTMPPTEVELKVKE